MAIQLRRGNEADFTPGSLLPAEPAYTLDTGRLVIGDGTGGADIIPTGAEVTQMILDAFAATLADARRGTIAAYAGSTAPIGTMLCDGAAVSRTTYAALFALIGTKYGIGNGSTTFNLPNLKGRVPVGMDALQSEFDTLGETGGAKTHTLTQAQLPNVDLKIGANEYNYDIRIGLDQRFTAESASLLTGLGGTMKEFATVHLGNGQAHNNLQPYTVVNYIIYY